MEENNNTAAAPAENNGADTAQAAPANGVAAEAAAEAPAEAAAPEAKEPADGSVDHPQTAPQLGASCNFQDGSTGTWQEEGGQLVCKA